MIIINPSSLKSFKKSHHLSWRWAISARQPMAWRTIETASCKELRFSRPELCRRRFCRDAVIKMGNVDITMINHPFLMVYSTHLWWLWWLSKKGDGLFWLYQHYRRCRAFEWRLIWRMYVRLGSYWFDWFGGFTLSLRQHSHWTWPSARPQV